ncbi:MAG: L-2,4-diaminobutyrate decarboxylase, partial [Sphingobacteriales bacterium UTBCD1]
MHTEEIISQLDQLSKISSRLDISADERKEMISELSGFTEKYISELNTQNIFSERKPGPLAIMDHPIPLSELLALYRKEVTGTGINAASGKHLGYIPAGGIFTSAVADFIAAITNPYAGVYYASPGAAAIENEVLQWLKSVFNFPGDSVGNLTSGGSVSALIAFTAARDKHGIKNEKIKSSVVYLTEQVHHSAQKALRIIGLEDIVLRYVPLDDHHRMKTVELKRMIVEDIASGLNPFLVIGTAGTTDTGAVDDLDAIADIAEKYK